MSNVVVKTTVKVSQSNSNVLVHVNNSSISTSRASLQLVNENPGKLAAAQSGAISSPSPRNNVLPRAKVHLGVAESPCDGAFEFDELLECKFFDINCDSVSHPGVRMVFKSEQQMLWYAKLWPLRVRDIDLGDLRYDCVDTIRCIKQQDEVFGFIPFTALDPQFILQDRTPTRVAVVKEFDPLQCHHGVKASGSFNCLGLKVQLSDLIDFKYLESLAPDYWDQQLFTFLRYGFPLDYNRAMGRLKSALVSHNSAIQFPQHVTNYLQEEKAEGAIFGPYRDPPFGQTSHISPFITRPKPDSNKRRVIVDLSFPQHCSVNDYVPRGIYMNTVFKLHYPNIDLITQKLARLGPGCHVYKVDLSRAFRQLFVDPGDLDLLCLYWQDSYFADCRVPFGYRNGSMFLT